MRYATKETISITTKILNESHCFEGGVYPAQYQCFWVDHGKEVKSSVNLKVSTGSGKDYIYFIDMETDDLPGIKTMLNCTVELVSTPCHFGGKRWWFLCPATNNDHVCNRRVGVLYMLPRGKSFGCSHCCRIRYKSSPKLYR